MHGLYGWLRRHAHLVDGTVAFAFVLAGLTQSTLMRPKWVAIPVLAAVAGPTIFRRAHPGRAFWFTLGAAAIQLVTGVGGNATDFCILIVLYTLAVHRPRRVSMIGLAVCLVSVLATTERFGPVHGSSLHRIGVVMLLLGGPTLLAWIIGDSVRWRRGYLLALEERATRLERERDAQAQIAAAAERARIAREMHDVVAHHVSVMVVQADGAAFALDTSAPRAREAMNTVSATGRTALGEMRRLLGVLRTADSPAELAPMPGVEQLGELLDQTRAGGIGVSFAVEGAPRQLAEGPDLAAYRVVQESLTNIRKHGGPHVSASVRLRYLDDALELRITDDGRGAAAHSDGAGHGLTGMRERVELFGGTIRTGPRAGGGYEVAATLPLTPAAHGGKPELGSNRT